MTGDATTGGLGVCDGAAVLVGAVMVGATDGEAGICVGRDTAGASVAVCCAAGLGIPQPSIFCIGARNANVRDVHKHNNTRTIAPPKIRLRVKKLRRADGAGG